MRISKRFKNSSSWVIYIYEIYSNPSGEKSYDNDRTNKIKSAITGGHNYTVFFLFLSTNNIPAKFKQLLRYLVRRVVSRLLFPSVGSGRWPPRIKDQSLSRWPPLVSRWLCKVADFNILISKFDGHPFNLGHLISRFMNQFFKGHL